MLFEGYNKTTSSIRHFVLSLPTLNAFLLDAGFSFAPRECSCIQYNPSIWIVAYGVQKGRQLYITSIQPKPKRCLTSPLIWSLYTQTIRCWGWGLCPAPGSTLKLAYHSNKRRETEHTNRATVLDQSSPLIQAEVESFPSGTREGSREMRARLTTLLFWGILVSELPVLWRTRLCRSYCRLCHHRRPDPRCDTTSKP